MDVLARGFSYVMYLAKAGATYTIPFPYLDAEHIRVFAGDAGDAVEQSFKWIGPTEINLTNPVPEKILVTLRRFTPRDRPMVDVQDGAQLPADDINRNTKQLLFALQEQIDFGSGGNKIPGGGAGWPDPGGNPSLPIQQIIDQIMQSPIMGLLVSRIDAIDDTAETLLEEILRSDKAFQYRHEDKARVALVEEKVTIIQDDQQSMAEKITDVYAKYDNAEAQIHVVQKAVSDNASATASSFEGVNARFKQNEADITTVKQAVSTETDARAIAIQQVSADIDKASSRITTVAESVANEKEARAQAIQKVYSDYTAADGEVTKAVNQTLQSTYATKDYAKSIAITQVEAWAGGNFAMLQQRFEALVDGTADPSSTGAWQANYTVRINAGAINGVPVIAGIGLGVDSKTGSNFVVMADRFAFVSPTYTTNGGVQQMKFPFVVGTVGGVSTVGITGQLVVDGSITADKIRVNSLSALTANMGEVNGGTFRTFQLDGNGNIINPLEFRAEMTNNPGDAYPLWVGGGVKNWNNAVFAVDRNGNAKFAGTIQANNMIGTLQKYVTASWSGDFAANTGGTTNAFTLDGPVRLGESHIPVVISELVVSSTSSDISRANITLQRLDGSTWVDVRTQGYTLRGGNSASYSMMYFGPPTTAATTYRIRISDAGVSGGGFHMYETNHYAFGLK